MLSLLILEFCFTFSTNGKLTELGKKGIFYFLCPSKVITAWKVSKYGVFSGSYLSVFSPIKEKYGSEKTRYLDTFHVVYDVLKQEKHKLL